MCTNAATLLNGVEADFAAVEDQREERKRPVFRAVQGGDPAALPGRPRQVAVGRAARILVRRGRPAVENAHAVIGKLHQPVAGRDGPAVPGIGVSGSADRSARDEVPGHVVGAGRQVELELVGREVRLQ